MKKVINKVELNKNKEKKMGFFDNMTKALFKENEDAETIYYAKGILRKGYIVPSEAQKKKLYNFHKRIFKYLFPVGIMYTLLLGLGGMPIIGFVPILVIALILHFKQKSLIKNLLIYEEKLTIHETKKTIANAFPKSFIIFMMINGVMGILLTISLPILLDDSMEELSTLMMLTFIMSIFLLGVGWYLYKFKKTS